jgi:hypothetical protein
MGCNAICTNCKRKEECTELNINIIHTTNTINSKKTNNLLSTSNINTMGLEVPAKNRLLVPSNSIMKQGSFSLSLNKSKFVNERKSKITDYYELLDIIGEGSLLI